MDEKVLRKLMNPKFVDSMLKVLRQNGVSEVKIGEFELQLELERPPEPQKAREVRPEPKFEERGVEIVSHSDIYSELGLKGFEREE